MPDVLPVPGADVTPLLPQVDVPAGADDVAAFSFLSPRPSARSLLPFVSSSCGQRKRLFSGSGRHAGALT
jgi:hypothetical protein